MRKCYDKTEVCSWRKNSKLTLCFNCLSGIMFVHGTSDNVTPVAQARTLDRAMTKLGIDHVYDEHGGGHDFIPSKSLQFLSDYLSDRLVETAVDAKGKLAITWGEIKEL